MNLDLGFSPCPNDTFMFDALVRGVVSDPDLSFTPVIEDVETLNRMVLANDLPVSKVSFHLLGHVRDRYGLLRSGAALGRGCGPIVVIRPGSRGNLRDLRVAIPGEYTTAALLLRLFEPGVTVTVSMPFDRIVDSVVAGEVDAGVIIHESRFTYRSAGLEPLVDLGEWWEGETGSPIPLGGIAFRRDLPVDVPPRLERLIRESILHARSHPADPLPFIRRHAREMDDAVCAAHIDLYVTDFSIDLGDEGRGAVERLFSMAEERGVIHRAAGGVVFP